MRDWSIEVVLVNDKGEDVPATIFDKVTYELHPSFGKRAKQGMLATRLVVMDVSSYLMQLCRIAKKEAPFRIEESGWGEFEMGLVFTPAGSTGDKKAEISIGHDLNFLETRYETVHDLVTPPRIVTGH
jgi:transcription initiation factor IIF auxiliary subunit